MTADQPLMAPFETVRPEWIDYNGHLNMAYYNVLFDHAVDDLFSHIGCGPDYLKTRGFSFFSAEAHVRYLRELKSGDRVRVANYILEHDEKRMRLYQELYHEDGWLSATSESLSLHIDMSGPRVAPFPDDIKNAIGAIVRDHRLRDRPAHIGRGIALSHQKPSP